MGLLIEGIPKYQIGIVGREGGGLTVSEQKEVPRLEDDMILVRNAAVALNPVDTKMAAPHLVCPGALAGHDFAGIVVAIGPKAMMPAPIRVGDRVCGAVQGLHRLTPDVGAYTEYVGADTVLKIPDNMSFEEAATLGIGISTMGLALFHNLQVPGYPTRPTEASKMVLLYGGSTASGTLGLQLLALCGLHPITTCSPANFDLVKSYGAVATFDYKDPDCVQKIKAYTRNSLRYVVDCVSEPQTMEFCYSCLGRSGGKLTTLEPPPAYLTSRAKTVKVDWVLGPALSGKPIGWPPPMEREADPEMRRFAKSWFDTVQELLNEGKIRPHPMKVMEGGLLGIMDGLDMLKKKQVSGQKLVYPLT